MSTDLHFVTVTHERDEDGEITSSTIAFECRGDESSPCRNYPDCECDEWYIETEDGKHVHPDVPQPECWIATWFDGNFGQEIDSTPYTGDGSRDAETFLWCVPEHSGPIDYEYEQGIYWHWPDLDGPEAWTGREHHPGQGVLL